MDWNLIFTVTLVGVTIVFTALVLLALFVYIYPKLLIKRKEKILQEVETTHPESIIESLPFSSELDEDELVAVITAAISAFGGSGYSSKIVVKNIKRVDTQKPVWNRISRLEALN